MSSEQLSGSEYACVTAVASTQPKEIERSESPRPDYIDLVEHSELSFSVKSDYVDVSEADKIKKNVVNISDSSTSLYCEINAVDIAISTSGYERPVQIVPPTIQGRRIRDNIPQNTQINKDTPFDQNEGRGTFRQYDDIMKQWWIPFIVCIQAGGLINTFPDVDIGNTSTVYINQIDSLHFDPKFQNRILTAHCGTELKIISNINKSTKKYALQNINKSTNICWNKRCLIAVIVVILIITGLVIAVIVQSINSRKGFGEEELLQELKLQDDSQSSLSTNPVNKVDRIIPTTDATLVISGASNNVSDTADVEATTFTNMTSETSATTSPSQSTSSHNFTTTAESETSSAVRSTSKSTSASSATSAVTVSVPGYPKDCKEIRNSNITTSKVYAIYPFSRSQAVNVMCDMTRDNGGWTMFQRRFDGSVDFYRTWQNYKNGFGNVAGEHWLDIFKVKDSGEKSTFRIFDFSLFCHCNSKKNEKSNSKKCDIQQAGTYCFSCLLPELTFGKYVTGDTCGAGGAHSSGTPGLTLDGNDILHQLTVLGESFLYIVLEDFNGNEYVAKYSNFTVASETDQYRMRVSTFIGGTAGNAIQGFGTTNVNGHQFSTYDRDNDHATASCAVARHGAWWYNICSWTNLNGRYPVDGNTCHDCNFWYTVTTDLVGFRKTTMMIKRK